MYAYNLLTICVKKNHILFRYHKIIFHEVIIGNVTIINSNRLLILAIGILVFEATFASTLLSLSNYIHKLSHWYLLLRIVTEEWICLCFLCKYHIVCIHIMHYISFSHRRSWQRGWAYSCAVCQDVTSYIL